MLVLIFIPIFSEINPAILEELKPIFLILELDVTTEVFGVKTVTELYNVLLRHYNNDFRKVVLAMREVFPVVVKDSHEVGTALSLSPVVISVNMSESSK